MIQEQWTRVDQYFTDLLVRSDPKLEAALKASDAAGLPQIQVASNQGKLLMLLARARTFFSVFCRRKAAARHGRNGVAWRHRPTLGK
jgi:predicted O-methyltransferase YrrM